MPQVLMQIRALLVKNFICGLRDREYLSDLILPIVTAVIVTLKEQLFFLGFFAPLFLSVAISIPPRSLMINLVSEKSNRYKESQKIMGMKQRSYIIGWIIYGYLKTIIATTILIILWVALNYAINGGDFGFIPEDSPAKIFSVYLLYSTAVLNFSLALSSIFSNTKLSSEVSTFILILSCLLTFLVFLSSVQESKAFYYLMSIFPQSCISFVYMGALEVSKSNFFRSKVIRETYSLDEAAVQLAIESVFYFVLYFYLDQVFPNEYGVAKHPFFFITDCFKTKKTKTEPLLKDNFIQDDGEDFSSAAYHQKLPNQRECTVLINALTKKFGNFTAVDKLSIKLYRSEILCLLGHNGAGKTTTISMLTGMIQKTSGTVIINGQDLEENLDAIRENVGICTQRDVLYDSLTVLEQMQFMGRVKGLEGVDLQNEIEETMRTTELEEEKDKLISSLSGGSKRKLSLAMALIGGSSVIFLDEPTSGMDAISRRSIWTILERVKSQNRTLVLTTHHLDEAEILADRIAIMAAGKLLACGKCDFIKTNFGEGYHLSIISPEQNVRVKAADIVSSHLAEAQRDPQSQSDTLLYLIPFKSKKKLLGLFEKLRNLPVMVNLKLNSLEDAFINIGMDESKFMKQVQMKMSINQDDTEPENVVVERQIEISKDIAIPKCLNRPPQYYFWNQFVAVFLRKQYTTLRSFSNYIGIIIPFTMIVVGTLVINELNFDFIKQPELEPYIKLTMISLFLILAFCFNSSVYVTLPVLEREFNLKYALNVMGCHSLPYWLGTLAFDYLIYLIFATTFVIFSYIMQLKFITEYIGLVILAFFGFGFSYINFSYFAGLALFKKTQSAMIVFPIMNFFIIYCLPQTIWGINALFWQKGIGSKKASEISIMTIECIFSFLSPFFSFQRAFQYIIKIDTKGFDNSPPPLTEQSAYYALAMLLSGVLYFLLTLVWELNSDSKIVQEDQKYFEKLRKSGKVDAQVFEEEERLVNAQYPIKCVRLRKVYENGSEALKDLSFGVEPEKIVGLLGPNGAGKSTAFGIFTSLIAKSGGQVKIQNKEVRRENSQLFSEVGICPQFDCIWENLTPKEHLYLFGRMKGLSGADLDESVEYFLQTMQLEEYVNRQAGKLSGGNKRKLCVSDALIGGPSIQFFDEPSTGVDPIARRFLWRTLKQGVKLRKSSVVLTTHTMDEAESLCDKIAILVRGQILCLGTPQELREKYGEGFNLILKCARDTRTSVLQALMKEGYSSAKPVQSDDEDNLVVHVSSLEFQFYEAFCKLSKLVEMKLISDFQFMQASLEQVFLTFSSQQHHPDQ